MTSSQRAFRSYWSDPNAPMSLGCLDCPNKEQCGGKTISGDGFNCLDNCCRQADTCQIVCPEALVFTDRVREIAGFDLQTPSASFIEPPSHVSYLPMLFHGSGCKDSRSASAVAMPLYRFFNRNGDCRFNSREEVADSFNIKTSTQVYLSGVAKDNEVERWWKLEAAGRIKAIANLRSLNISMVTTPNFSLMVDRPRWDDMHSMKRIAAVYHEFVSEGMPTALHVNARTAHDFARWGDYVSAHPEVTHLAYEFTTGARSPARMQQHALWLAGLGVASGRRLGLILRGGSQVIRYLSTHFDITFIDSSPFEKAQHREIAYLDAQGQRRWLKCLTPRGQPIDKLLKENVSVSMSWLDSLIAKLPLAA